MGAAIGTSLEATADGARIASGTASEAVAQVLVPASQDDKILARSHGLVDVPTKPIHKPSGALNTPIFVTVWALKLASEATAGGAAKASDRATKAIAHALFLAAADDKIFARETPSDAASNASSGAAP